MASHVHARTCLYVLFAYIRPRLRELSLMKIGLADERHLHANEGSNCMHTSNSSTQSFNTLP
eukprot:4505865-Karenia_brevis.AAC.1